MVPSASLLIGNAGTVIRTGQVKLLEAMRQMQCGKCKYVFTIHSDPEQRNAFPKIDSCRNRDRDCPGKTFTILEESKEAWRDYQDIKVQERVARVGVGYIPRSVMVLLTDDLVDTVQAGDNLEITGILLAPHSAGSDGISYFFCRDSSPPLEAAGAGREDGHGDIHSRQLRQRA